MHLLKLLRHVCMFYIAVTKWINDRIQLLRYHFHWIKCIFLFDSVYNSHVKHCRNEMFSTAYNIRHVSFQEETPWGWWYRMMSPTIHGVLMTRLKWLSKYKQPLQRHLRRFCADYLRDIQGHKDMDNVVDVSFDIFTVTLIKHSGYQFVTEGIFLFSVE